MNISSLKEVSVINKGASENQIMEIKRNISVPLDYLDLLRIANGIIFDDGIKIYSADEVVERNKTFEVAKYAPGYVAIGDNSGGRCVLMSLSTGEISHVDMGSMNPKYKEHAALSLQEWIDKNCHIAL